MPYFLILYLGLKVDLKYFICLLSIGIAYQIEYEVRENIKKEELNNTLAKSGKHLAFFALLLILVNICR